MFARNKPARCVCVLFFLFVFLLSGAFLQQTFLFRLSSRCDSECWWCWKFSLISSMAGYDLLLLLCCCFKETFNSVARALALVPHDNSNHWIYLFEFKIYSQSSLVRLQLLLSSPFFVFNLLSRFSWFALFRFFLVLLYFFVFSQLLNTFGFLSLRIFSFEQRSIFFSMRFLDVRNITSVVSVRVSIIIYRFEMRDCLILWIEELFVNIGLPRRGSLRSRILLNQWSSMFLYTSFFPLKYSLCSCI